jgi:hypothetical protein
LSTPLWRRGRVKRPLRLKGCPFSSSDGHKPQAEYVCIL